MKTLIIGDPHFKHRKALEECKIYSEKVIAIAQTQQPTFIVVLGDVLDTHEIVRVQPHNLVESFFEGLSAIAPTYVLIGNHDYINNSQFLTNAHIFGPFKKWPNLYIIDRPLYAEIEDKSFVFMPYVPPGRFIEALDTLIIDGYENWELVDCIFAHQEFKGCKLRSGDDFKSTLGDEWDAEYPLVISGHIHNFQRVGSNIIYAGSSIQHFHTESGQKHLLLVEWDEEGEYPNEPKITKLKIGMKIKKLLHITPDELVKKDAKYIERITACDLKINLIGTPSDFASFQKNKLYDALSKKGAIFSYETTETNTNPEDLNLRNAGKDDVCYDKIFRTIISKKDKLIQSEYRLLFGDFEEQPPDSGPVALRFVDDSDDDDKNEHSKL
jgi:hypothetical protein